MLLPDGRPAAGATVFLDEYFHTIGAEDDGMPVHVRYASMKEDGSWVWHDDPGPLPAHVPHQTRTDEQGAYVFADSPRLRETLASRIKVWATLGELVAHKVELRVEGPSAQVSTLELGPSLQPRVLLRARGGKAVVDAHVMLTLEREPESTQSLYIVGARSGPDGMATLPRVPDRADWSAWVQVEPKKRPVHTVSPVGLDRFRRGGPLILWLPDGFTVEGRVVFPDGSAAGGIRVSTGGTSSVVTDAEGAFALIGIPNDATTLLLYEEPPEPELPDGPPWRVSHSYPPHKCSVPVKGREGATVDVGTVRLVKTLSISGVVLGKDGEPARHGVVAGQPLGPDGRFEVGGFEPGTHTLEATTYDARTAVTGSPMGELVAKVDGIHAGATDVVIRVTGGGNLILRLHAEDAPTEPLEVWQPSVHGVAGGVGAGHKTSELRAVFEPGRHTDLVVEAEGYEPQKLAPVVIHADRETVVDVVLRRRKGEEAK